jgi:uncharacterized protein YutE (UPF0331/DUF86 family)
VLDRDLVLEKVATLDRCLARLADARSNPALSVLDVQDVTALNLQRAVQAMIDLAAHVVAREGLGTPDSLGASFTLLENAGILDADLAGHMRRMTGFRNIAVHQYRKLDPAIVDGIVRDRLGELRRFATQILARSG